MFTFPAMLFGGNSVPEMVNGAVITTSGMGARIVPAGVTEIDIEIWGAGGGSAGTPDPGEGSGGGGSGAYCKRNNLSVTPGDEISFNIGAFGARGSSFGISGSNGGDTTCDSMTAGGGLGSVFFGAAGGTASGGDTNTNGNAGANRSGSTGGVGGSAPSGGGAGGAGGVAGVSTPVAGSAPGGGGGGASGSGTAGANGANGAVKFTW